MDPSIINELLFAEGHLAKALDSLGQASTKSDDLGAESSASIKRFRERLAAELTGFSGFIARCRETPEEMNEELALSVEARSGSTFPFGVPGI